MLRINVLCFLALAAFLPRARAQENGPAQIRTSVSEVVVDAVVHDKHGKIVKNIDPADFSIYDNGVKQDVRSLRLVSGQEVRMEDVAPSAGSPSGRAVSPLREVNIICVVFQDLTPETRKPAMDAALEFLNNELRPGTYIGVFTLDDRGVRPMYRFTNNAAALAAAIRRAAVRQTPDLGGSSQQIFTAFNAEMGTVGTPPPLPAQAEGGPAPSAGGSPVQAMMNPAIGSGLDASTADPDDSTVAVNNPLGRQGIHNERVYAMREMTAFKWLVAQLGGMPFRKTVLLFSPGINRPADQVDTWQKLLARANELNVTFYVAEVTGTNIVSPLTPVRAGMDQTRSLSNEQSAGISNLGDAANRAQEFDAIAHTTATANTEAMLRDLAESTGGFLITDLGAKKMASIMNDVQTHYVLTYRPTSEDYDGSFHKIDVKLARADLRVEARPGYYAVPANPDGGALTPLEMAGLRALNTTPLPHSFEYRADALLFPGKDGRDEAVAVFELPRTSLTATAVPQTHSHLLHASFFGVIKDAQGQVIDQFSADAPEELPDASWSAASTGWLSFQKRVDLAPGRYTLETSVVDWESGKSSTVVSQFACPDGKGPRLSSVALVARADDIKGAADPADPLEGAGKHIVPTLVTDLAPNIKPSIFFRVYPDASAAAHPLLRAQFLLNGELVADQKTELPAPDASGSIPVLIQPPARTGSNELRLVVMQGSDSSAVRAIHYTVEAK